MSKVPQLLMTNDSPHVVVASNLLTKVPSGLQRLKQVPRVGSLHPRASTTSAAGSTDDLELVIKLQEPHASASSPSGATLTILHNFDFKILAMLVSSAAKTCTSYKM
jgi:hypothetical protein